MGQNLKHLLRNLYKLLVITYHEDPTLVSLYFLSSVFGAILLFVVYYVYKIMIDQVTASTIPAEKSILAIIIITYLFFEYLSRFVNYTFNQYFFDTLVRLKLQNVLTRFFIDKLGKLDFVHLENGDVRNLIAKVEGTYNFRLPEIIHYLNNILFSVLVLIFSLLIALKYSPIYFLILAIISIPVYYLRAKYGNLAASSLSANASNTNYLWYIRSIFTNFSTLSEMKIYRLREYFLNRADELQERILSDYQKPLTSYTMLSTLSFLLIPVAIYFSLSHFINGIRNHIYTIGDFTLFLNTLFTFSGQISGLLVNVGNIYENSFFLDDYIRLLGIKNIVNTSTHPYSFPITSPREIVFKNVSFRYQGSSNLSLNHINFTILKGQNIALVGHNGAGKSTLIKLLLRFYDPTEGDIFIDGANLKDISIDNWYQHIGILFQDFAKYYLTLRDNIKFGNIDEKEDYKIIEALCQSQSEPLIKSLPHGLDQILGRWFHSGIELSGGQWQKIAIARAIFRNAPILIMDEPTSNIDADAEATIFKNLQSLYKNKNLIFISHRFSTVRTADNILVLEKGKLAEEGTHKELIKKKGIYAEFFKLQKRGYE